MSKNYGVADQFYSTQHKRKYCVIPNTENSSKYHIFVYSKSYTKKDGTTVDYYVCRDCKLAQRNNKENPRLQSISLSGPQILTNPNIPHYPACCPIDSAKLKIIKLHLEANEACRNGIKRPLQAHMDLTAKIARVEQDPQEQEAMIMEMVPYHSRCRTYYRHTAKSCPPVPDPMNLDPALRTTYFGSQAPAGSALQNEPWCIYQKNGMLIFASRRDLSQLFQSQFWIADGTFEYAPTDFGQYYTIHGFVSRSDGTSSGEASPLIRALLPDKTGRTYREFFGQIRQALEAAHTPAAVNLISPTILLDFELAARTAIKEAFPASRLSGCTFHFGQAVHRRAVELGLKTALEQDGNPDAKRWFGRILALAIFPTHFIEPEWVQRLRFPPVTADPMLNYQLQSLAAYFEKTWIYGTAFPLKAWTHWENHGPRTTNYAEGYHNKLNTTFGRSHPSVSSFLQFLQKEHHTSTCRIIQLVGGMPPKPRKSEYVYVDQEIDKAKKSLLYLIYYGQATLVHMDQYLGRISHLMGRY